MTQRSLPKTQIFLHNKKDLANSFQEMTQPLVFQSAFLMIIYIYNRIIN